jgi:hypothetical protein
LSGNVEHRRSSIERAKALLGEPRPDDDVVVLKLQPEPQACCCFHCWPGIWGEVTHFLAEHGRMEDEGDLLVKTDGGSYVLECHESGPEIVLYLTLAAATLNLIKPTIELITLFAKGLRWESRGARLKLTSRRISHGETDEEVLMEIDLPLSPDTAKRIEAEITRSLRRNARLPGKK